MASRWSRSNTGRPSLARVRPRKHPVAYHIRISGTDHSPLPPPGARRAAHSHRSLLCWSFAHSSKQRKEQNDFGSQYFLPRNAVNPSGLTSKKGTRGLIVSRQVRHLMRLTPHHLRFSPEAICRAPSLAALKRAEADTGGGGACGAAGVGLGEVGSSRSPPSGDGGRHD